MRGRATVRRLAGLWAAFLPAMLGCSQADLDRLASRLLALATTSPDRLGPAPGALPPGPEARASPPAETPGPALTPVPSPSPEPSPGLTPAPVEATPTPAADTTPTSGPDATPSPSPEATATPVSTPTPTPTPTPLPEALGLTSLATEGIALVRVAWPPDAGPASITRNLGSTRETWQAKASPYLDRITVGYATDVDYEVLAGGRRFAGSIRTAEMLWCASSNSDGPPDCDWKQTSPGVTPYDYCFSSTLLPTLPSPATFRWSDTKSRAGYLVLAGLGTMRCDLAPPFEYAGSPVAYTPGTSIEYGQNPGIAGLTDDPDLSDLLARAGLLPGPWPTKAPGKALGWKIRPVVKSADGRSVTIGAERILPRLYSIE